MAKQVQQQKNTFGTPEAINEICIDLQRIEDLRAVNRAKINVLFNGGKPYTAEEEKKFQIQINVNWGMGPRIMQDANRQLNNALLHPGLMFTCSLEDGPVDKRDTWSQIFTDEIHKPLQRGKSGKRHAFVIKSRNATIALHGIGALMWPNDFRWLPRFVALEDLLIPTDTYCDFTNLRYFAVNLYLTPGELVDMTRGDMVDKGWNKAFVAEILDEVSKRKSDGNYSTWRDQPEAMMEIFKQNQGWNYSDAVPKIRLRSFFHQDIKTGKWFRKIVLREAIGSLGVDKFVYDSPEPFAADIDHILNVQYGDSSLVAPLKYHSVRGLGVPLFAPVETLNRLQCEFVQHVFENMKMYFRVQDPADRDRLKQVVLSAYGFIPEGLNIVRKDERHQIDGNLVTTAMGQMRQIMQENSSSFVQDVEQSTGAPITAKEATIRVNQANQMVGGMLQMVYFQETFYYAEIVRRFCSKTSNDPEVKKFRAAVIKRGVPEDMLVADKWHVAAERVLGSGDASIAQLQTQWLMTYRQQFDPQAQQKILRLATATMLQDPAKAEMFVPEAPVTATNGTFAAENVFGTLMTGVECAERKGIDQQGYIEALLVMMGTVVQRIQNTDNVGTIDEIIGLQNVAKNIGQHLMILAANEQEKSRVKQYGDILGKLMNEVKGFAQRYMEQKQQEQEAENADPAAEAKAQSTIMLANVKAQISKEQAAAKERLKMLTAKMDSARKDAETLASIRREDLKHRQDMFSATMADTQKLLAQERMSAAKLASQKAMTAAKVQASKATKPATNGGGN